MPDVISARVMKGEGPCTKPNGIAISRPVSEALNVNFGDPIQVTASKTTVAIIESIENMQEPIVYLGRMVRPNCGAHWDEPVQLKKLENKVSAKKITIAPADPDQTLDADQDALKSILVGTYIVAGDLIEVGLRSFRRIFMGHDNISKRSARMIVIETKPSGIVQITQETELIVHKEYMEREGRRPSITYDDIGGLKDALQKVREQIEIPLRNPKLFERLGIEPPKGILLHGPPGCGKTLLAKAAANESGAHFINIGASHLPPQDADRRLREVFGEAEQHQPSIIFIDEIDCTAPKREESFSPDDRRIVGSLLELMDGMKARGQVIVMAATNRVNSIDSALRRPGRFDREIEIGVPNEDERLEILKIHTRYMPLEEDVDQKKLAENTHGYSGADLRALCQEAAMSCVRRFAGKFNPDLTIPDNILNEMKVNMNDFIEGSKRVTPSLMREIVVERPKIRWDQVGGYEDLKDEIEVLVIIPWSHRADAKRFGIKVPKGILLYGDPGTGKTYLAKAIANRAGSNVIVVKAQDLLSKWLGESEQNVAKLFEKARKVAPVVIIIDEVETLASVRGISPGEAGKTFENIVNILLQQLDGVEEIHDVFLICTTNRPDLIDTAFLRSGRVDRHFYIPRPDAKARAEIFKVHMADLKIPLSDDITVERLAELTDGLVGADIARIVQSAKLKWFCEYINHKNNKELKLEMRHFLKAIEEAKSSLTLKRRREIEALPIQINE